MLPILSPFAPPPPHLLKTTHSSFNRYLSSAKSDSRGIRSEMEDACISRVQLVRGMGFFAVCDGHGGVKTAKLLSKLLPNTVAAIPKDACNPKLQLDLNSDECLKHAYLNLDKKIAKKLGERDVSGSTCVSLCILYKPLVMPKYDPQESNSSKKASPGAARSAGTPPSGKLSSIKKKKSSFTPHTPPSSQFGTHESSSPLLSMVHKKTSPLASTTLSRAKSASSKQKRRIKNLKIDVDLANGEESDEIVTFTPIDTLGSSSSTSSLHAYANTKKPALSPTNNRTLRYQLICLNTGDSRCIMYNKNKTVALSEDHKPTDPRERARIKKAGYDVVMGRVDGMLAVSRAFGDEQFKRSKSLQRSKQAVVATPDIVRVEVELSDSDQDYSFVVLACDGIFDCMTNEDVTKFILQRMKKYDLWNNDHRVNHTEFLHTQGWYYTRPAEWTHKMVSEWRDTLTIQLRDLFPRKPMNGVELSRWLEYEMKRNKGIAGDKFKKLQRYVEFLDEKITRFLQRPPARTTAEKLQIIAENLIDECILVRGSQDNCTVNIVLLHHPNWVASQVQHAKENHRASAKNLLLNHAGNGHESSTSSLAFGLSNGGGSALSTPVHSDIDSPANFQLLSPSSNNQQPMVSPKHRLIGG